MRGFCFFQLSLYSHRYRFYCSFSLIMSCFIRIVIVISLSFSLSLRHCNTITCILQLWWSYCSCSSYKLKYLYISVPNIQHCQEITYRKLRPRRVYFASEMRASCVRHLASVILCPSSCVHHLVSVLRPNCGRRVSTARALRVRFPENRRIL